MALTATEILSAVHDKDRKALKAMIRIYGDDVSTILNALVAMAARVAVASDVSPEDFAAGIKHHWDFLASVVNEYAEQTEGH